MYSLLPKYSVRLLVEWSSWIFISGAFLGFYTLKFNGPNTAIFPHFLVVSIAAFSLAGVRYVFYRIFSTNVAISASAALMSAVVFILISYYLAVIAGLDSWGRVISLALMKAYLAQLPPLLDVLGITPVVIAVAIFSGYLFIYYAISRYLTHWDWVEGAVKLGSSAIITTIVSLFMAISFLAALDFVEFPPSQSGEPFALTLSPANGALRSQGYGEVASKHLDLIERTARDVYQPVILDDPTNVIVVVVDALRGDHLSVNGYGRVTTPNIDKLVMDNSSSRIARMYSACAQSACGLMALSSSRYTHRLPSHPISIQEVLHRHGYGVHLILSGDHTNFYGLREAYGSVDTYFDGSMSKEYYINSDEGSINRLRNFPEFNGKPSFFQFHLMSAHVLSERTPESSVFKPTENYAKSLVGPAGWHFERRENHLNFYDNGVVQSDNTINRIIEILKEKRYLKKALVLITADHGELLGEHGLYMHAKSVYEPVLNVPFILLRYGYEPQNKIDESVVGSQVDVAPTILTELGMPIPMTWSGLPLQNSSSESLGKRKLYFQQGVEFGLVELQLAESRWKYWVNAKSGTEYAFELLSDPGEQRNRVSELSELVKASWRRELVESEILAKDALN